MTRTLPALLAALVAATVLAGCAASDADATRIVIDFPEPRADVQARVALADIAALGTVNAHNQLLAWSAASGTDVDVRSFTFGHCLDAIDGVPATPGCDPGAAGSWSLSFNGQEAASGMDEILLAAGDKVRWSYVALDASSSASSSGPTLKVDVPPATKEDMVMLTGTLDRDAKLSVTGAKAIDAKAGSWMVHVPLEYGQTPITVVADDGVGTTQAQVVAVRLASVTLAAEFVSALPPRQPIEDTVWLDLDALLSNASYAGKGIPHPPHPNVHDAMVAWTLEAGRPVEFSYSESFAFGVESIDGHGALSDWCYSINGETADLGITGQELRPGDVIEWGGCFGA